MTAHQWWIAHDPGVETGEIARGDLVTTDKRSLEVFDEEAAYLARLAELAAGTEGEDQP